MKDAIIEPVIESSEQAAATSRVEMVPYPAGKAVASSFIFVAVLFLLSLFFPHNVMEGPTADPIGFQTLEVTDPLAYSLKEIKIPWYLMPFYQIKQMWEGMGVLPAVWRGLGFIFPYAFMLLLFAVPFLDREDNAGSSRRKTVTFIVLGLFGLLLMAGLEGYGLSLFSGR